MRRLLRGIRLRLWALAHRRQHEYDLRDELAHHLAMRQIHGGRGTFGNPTRIRDTTRDLWTFPWLDHLERSIRHAVRALVRTPGLSVTIVLTLGLGIGATSAVFSALDALVLRPVRLPQPDRLVLLLETSAGDAEGRATAPPRLLDWRRLNRTFEALTGYGTESIAEQSGALPEQVTRARVAPGFLQVAGVQPAVGRDFTAEEEVYGGPRAALISDGFWRRRFGASPTVIGRALRLDGQTYPIVGVMPPSFRFPDTRVDVWHPFPIAGAPYAELRTLNWFVAVGRLAPGVGIGQARADMRRVQADLGRQYPGTDDGLGVQLDRLQDLAVPGGVRRSLWLVFGAVTLLLLVACTNIAALLLARAVERRHEVSVRAALGASRASIVAQRLVEVCLLSVVGGALGLAIATSASRIFGLFGTAMPQPGIIAPDWHLVAFAAMCSVVVTVLCGLLPARAAARRDAAPVLAESGRSQVSGRGTLQWTMVGFQVALAVVLLAGAGLLVRSFDALGRVARGFDASRVLTMQLSMAWAEALPGNGQADLTALGQWSQRMLDGLRRVPGVEEAAFAGSLPGLPFGESLVELQLGDKVDAVRRITAAGRSVSPAYFATLHVPLLDGQPCDENLSGVPDGVLVNQRFVDTYIEGRAVGRRLRAAQGEQPPYEIRGVVGDVREHGLREVPRPTMYVCTSLAFPGSVFLVRTGATSAAVVPALRAAIDMVDPGRAVFQIVPLEQRLSDARGEERMRAFLFAFFAASAVLLVSLGLHGTLGYVVGARRREVGLRLALGARPSGVLWRFLSRGLLVTGFGAIAGLVLALGLGAALESMLFGVTPTDPPTLAGVVTFVIVVAGAASAVPSLRASRVEPADVLRSE